MINVPVRVRDALKDGRRLKEYRFLCSEPYTTVTENNITLATLNSTDNETVIFNAGRYRFFNRSANIGMTAQMVMASGGTYYINVPKETGATSTAFYFDIGEETAVTITNFDGGSEIDIQTVAKEESSGYTYRFTIDNDSLVYESVKFDERTCSTSTLKFGLCEGASLELQYFGYPNINKYRIEAYIDVQYETSAGTLSYYSIPMGFFYVSQCARQASTGIYKLTAYNKLKSEYLDANANTILDVNLVNPSIELTLYDIKKMLLQDYQTDIYEDQTQMSSMSYWIWSKGYTASFKTKTFADSAYTSPLNIRMMGGTYTSTSSFTTVPRSDAWHWDLDSTKTYTISIDYDIDEAEDIVYSAISKAIQKSGINNPATQLGKLVKTLQYDYSSFDEETLRLRYPTAMTGWIHVYSIILKKPNDTYEWYSKVGYTNKLTNCIGSMMDLTHKILTGYTDMWFVWPQSFGKGSMNDGTWQSLWDIDVADNFEYYKPGGTVDTGIYSAQPFPSTSPAVSNITGINPADLITVNPYNLPEFTLRDIISATYETVCQYGRLSRTTDLFSGVELNHSRLYPAVTLYPDNALYPGGNSESGDASIYQKLWTDSSAPDSFRNLIITYKALDSNNAPRDFLLEVEVNSSGTVDYNMDNNWIFKNLIWTKAQVQTYADAMVSILKDVRWIPFEMWAAGLPYLETGDEIELITPDGTFPSYILQRTLSGIQNLQDTYINGTLDIF